MSEAKKLRQVAVRGEGRFWALTERMQQRREAANWSDYVRGLVLIDAMQCGESIADLDVPGWALASILRLHGEALLGSRAKGGAGS